MHHVLDLLVPGFGRPVLLCRGKMPRDRLMAAYVQDGYGAFRQPKYECGWCEMLFFRVCGVRQNQYVYGIYRHPDLDDRIFYCLLSMAAVQAEDVRASLMFVGDSNANHQEWLGFTTQQWMGSTTQQWLGSTTQPHGVAALDFV